MPADRALDFLGRVRREAEVARLRARNGIRMAGGRKPARSGCTPKDVVWKLGHTELWHYRRPDPDGDLATRPVILLIHSLVSRSYVLDLQPGNSLVEDLTAAGADVFLLDWGVADERDADNTLETYIDDLMPLACAQVYERTREPINLVGYCLGGILSVLYAARHDEVPLASLSTLAAPIDFDQLGMVVSMLRDGRLTADDLIDETGNIPPEVFRQAFRVMQPTAEVTQYVNLLQNLWNERFLDSYQAMSRWVTDHVPFPGGVARQATDVFIRDNALHNQTLSLGGELVDLGAIACPVLCVLAERDHIVPAEAAAGLPALITGTTSRELRLPAGHVGLVMGKQAKSVMVPALMDHIHASTPATKDR